MKKQQVLEKKRKLSVEEMERVVGGNPTIGDERKIYGPTGLYHDEFYTKKGWVYEIGINDMEELLKTGKDFQVGGLWIDASDGWSDASF